VVPVVEAEAQIESKGKSEAKRSAAPAEPKPKPQPAPYWRQHLTPAPHVIEPNRKRRLTRERDPIEARIDLHGLGQFQAEDRLKDFLVRAQDAGLRAVLVITGKGVSGDGVIRRRAPEWLADPALRAVVAGVGQAHPRHGGEGALYVAIKRRATP
jgi:DNA-nicking Smr family endonuclease